MEKMTNILLLSIISLTISISSAQLSQVPDWDLLVFTQQWPITVCKEWKDKDQTHSCFLPKDQDAWTIHGIWPTILGKMGPQFCNRSWHFDPEEIKPIETTLTQLWPGIESGHTVYSLWAHEWTKHGTCAAVLDTFNSEFKYFMNGLNWLKKYSMNDILRAANIVPSNTIKYSLQSIYNAVKGHLGVNPIIECRKEDGVSYLVEIRICVKKDLDLTDCDGIVHNEIPNIYNIMSNCQANEGISYLQDLGNKTFMNKLIVQLYKLISWLQWFTL